MPSRGVPRADEHVLAQPLEPVREPAPEAAGAADDADGHRDSRRARPTSPRTSGATITTGVTTARRPSASIAGARAASAGSRTNVPASPCVEAGDPDHRGLVAERLQHPGERAAERPAADERGDRDDVRRARGERLPDPGHSEDRPDRDERVGRRDEDGLRLGDRLEHARRRPRVLGAAIAHAEDRVRVAAPDEPGLEVELPAPRSRAPCAPGRRRRAAGGSPRRARRRAPRTPHRASGPRAASACGRDGARCRGRRA